MEHKPPILVVYDYFYPGYKAGGPVQSLTNLIIKLQNVYSFHVLTSAYDIHSSAPYSGIETNKWKHVSIPGLQESIPVFYADANGSGNKKLKAIIEEANPLLVYLNGIFSFKFFLRTLLVSRSLRSRPKVVVCPRGMLQKGALAVKPVKKKFYLNALRFSGFTKDVTWHATNHEEAVDIKKQFPLAKEVYVAANIPKQPYDGISILKKEAGSLRLIYLSLITRKKNLLFVLQLMQQCKSKVSLDVCGPKTDQDYWQACEALIKQMPASVRYCGDVQPHEVQKKLADYHAMILLTKGENFGHALYESLSVGRPIITSRFTPWNDLQQCHAGINVDIDNAKNCLDAMEDFADMHQSEYNDLCEGANKLASRYFQNINVGHDYSKLFV